MTMPPRKETKHADAVIIGTGPTLGAKAFSHIFFSSR
jgi:hypothetical protein